MNTGQNYGGKGKTATTLPLAAQNSAQTPSIADNRQSLTRHQKVAYLDYLWLNEKITDQQRDWSTLVPVPDNSMAPLMGEGGQVVAYLLDPKEYKGRTGKVVAVSTGNALLVGRLTAINRQTVVLSHDNTDYPATIIDRKSVRQLSECIWSFGSPII